MSKALSILRSNYGAAAQRVEKLGYSLHKVSPLFPLNPDALQGLDEAQEESIDALILRYSQCVSMIQDHLFRGIAHVEQEDLSDKSNRDKTLLMEKLGAIRSADAFGTATMLRNKFPHHYPELLTDRIERLNLVIEEARFVINTFQEITVYLQRKGFFAA